jgi:hypothetical protein
MTTLRKKAKKAFFIGALVTGMMFGGTPQSKADGNDTYFNNYYYYLAYYNATGNTTYYYKYALSNYYYWYAGDQAESYSYNNDSYGRKSTNYNSGAYGPYYYNLYNYYGDYYYNSY